MIRILGCSFLVLLMVSCSLSLAGAEDIYKLGSPINIKMGDNNWEVKVANYMEKPHTSREKMAEVAVTFLNLSPDNKIQAIDPDHWSLYFIGNDNSSFKANHYKRDPGQSGWYGRQDVLPNAPFPARISVSIPKEVSIKQVVIMGEVASPSQVSVEIPRNMSAGITYLPSSPSSSRPRAVSSSPSSGSTGLENEAQAGFGVVVGKTLGLSGIYWAINPLGGQVIVGQGGASESLSVNARLLLKYFAMPFGRLTLAPQVGYQFDSSGKVSKSSYGVVAGAEFIMPFPVTIVGGRNLISTHNTWLSFLALEKAKAIGVTGELGLYGTGIRNINLDPEKLTKGFSMAGHVYL